MQCEMKVGGQWQCLQQAFHVFIPFVISFFFLLCKEFGSDSKRKKKWCVSQCELLTPATSSASEERLCFLHRERFPHKYMYEWVGRGPISCPRYGLNIYLYYFSHETIYKKNKNKKKHEKHEDWFYVGNTARVATATLRLVDGENYKISNCFSRSLRNKQQSHEVSEKQSLVPLFCRKTIALFVKSTSCWENLTSPLLSSELQPFITPPAVTSGSSWSFSSNRAI